MKLRTLALVLLLVPAPAVAQSAGAAPAQGAQTNLGVTYAAFRSIQPGMTREAIDALTGVQGTLASSMNMGGSVSETWSWKKGPLEFFNVTFNNGKAMMSLQAGLSPAGNAPAVSLAQFNQFADGITYQQAVQILGSPGTFTGFTDVMGMVSQGYSWKGASLGSMMTASFRDGKLTTKFQAGLR
ncbi:MAG TPA: hypothetical protein VFQ45_11430 [Longimicrobium sp.]|nr:hypothetical protein [Longimicrobium sp.]